MITIVVMVKTATKVEDHKLNNSSLKISVQ